VAAFKSILEVQRKFFHNRTLEDWWLFLRAVLIVLGLYYLLFSWIENRMEPLPETDRTMIYPYSANRPPDHRSWGQGAVSKDRQTFYYTPQGANLLDIRYAWFVHLERPWKKDRFALPKYMRAYGFIVDPEWTEKNPDQLPVGLASRWDQTMGETALDLTCAACHTGQLEINTGAAKYSVRIDGGQAMHDLMGKHAGHFAVDLAASLTATAINPFKWNRFCANILGNGDYSWHCALPFPDVLGLYWKLASVIGGVIERLAIETRLDLVPVEEGYGRTDALDRIANNTFAKNLHMMSNYRPTNAPVSYPPVWDAWKLDYVQYMGSAKQPMARNIGESLGSGATYYLVDGNHRPVAPDARYVTSTAIANLNRIEEALRNLTPPEWPEQAFGRIDWEKADAGKRLFLRYCFACHGPHYDNSGARMKIDAPLKERPDQHWITRLVPLEVIGTDKTSALNFVNYRFDLSRTGITSDEIRKLLKPVYEEDYRRRFGAPNGEKDEIKKAAYIDKQLSSITPSSVSTGQGLQYIIGFIRDRAYRDMDLSDETAPLLDGCKFPPKRLIVCDLDGFGQLDMPREQKAYRPRPLMGIWATPPFLHNGSVPTLYALLSPAYERPATFFVKSRRFDPRLVGLDDDGTEKNAFQFDTRIPGNLNVGHEFRDGFRARDRRTGVIGPELTKDERFEIIEFMKTMKECDFTDGDWERAARTCGVDSAKNAVRGGAR
jgi:mono/diheme cytochrome c family protein